MLIAEQDERNAVKISVSTARNGVDVVAEYGDGPKYLLCRVTEDGLRLADDIPIDFGIALEEDGTLAVDKL